ncbi:hypothetical protein CBF45_07780 [Bordetella sp. J329]|nr:hypothetical protein CBF45_07780 [Bordetella sp. J329]
MFVPRLMRGALALLALGGVVPAAQAASEGLTARVVEQVALTVPDAAETTAASITRQHAERCFDKVRAVLVGLESRASGLKLDEFVDAGLVQRGSEEWDVLELGYRLDVPTDRKLKDFFMKCLDEQS